MEEIRFPTKCLLVAAFALLAVLLLAPVGYKHLGVSLLPSLLSLPIAMIGGLLVFAVGAFYLRQALQANLQHNVWLIAASMLLGLVPIPMSGPQVVKAFTVPAIHDITTDTENPPVFVAALKERKNAPNGSEYGASANWPASKLAATTLEAYPEVRPVFSEMDVPAAVARAENILKNMQLEIIAVNKEEGRVEATATTFWFGFKDDLVVRVMPEAGGSRLDLRSMSRLGQSDAGANAARIIEFIERF